MPSFELLCVNDDSCVAAVLNFCFLVSLLSQVHHSAICVLVTENVFSVLQKECMRSANSV